MLHVDKTDTCWLWTGALSSGYGMLRIGGRGGHNRYVHRVAYEELVGPIPDGLEIDHLCRVRACFNPAHLEPVTPQQNVRRGESPGARALRRSDCLYGHPYADHGVIRQGRRRCRLCQMTYNRLHKRIPFEEIMRRKSAGLPVVDLAAHFATEERAA